MNDTFRVCPQCHKEFSLTFKQKIWYFKRDLHPPMYCAACRKQRREHPDPYDGWQYTMKTGCGHYRRHSMVPYAPFVVGGLTH